MSPARRERIIGTTTACLARSMREGRDWRSGEATYGRTATPAKGGAPKHRPLGAERGQNIIERKLLAGRRGAESTKQTQSCGTCGTGERDVRQAAELLVLCFARRRGRSLDRDASSLADPLGHQLKGHRERHRPALADVRVRDYLGGLPRVDSPVPIHGAQPHPLARTRCWIAGE
ncbi:hypothetical protein VTN02DRAFT_6127 [Thermoascus thermophilus]